MQIHQGAQIEPYLAGLHAAFELALANHSRIFVVRFDLHFSQHFDLPDIAVTNIAIQKFCNNLRYRLDRKDDMTRVERGRVNPHDMRFAWAREIGPDSGLPHYHVALLLNGDAYRSIGDYSDPEAPGLYRRLQEAWASAIRLDFDLAHGLVSVVPNGQWMLHRGDDYALANAFYACSYLCKAETKVFELGFHCFGTSRS
ncbi:MAG: inovirus Gp2 family protein [Halopseudomonas sabulinigri]